MFYTSNSFIVTSGSIFGNVAAVYLGRSSHATTHNVPSRDPPNMPKGPDRGGIRVCGMVKRGKKIVWWFTWENICEPKYKFPILRIGLTFSWNGFLTIPAPYLFGFSWGQISRFSQKIVKEWRFFGGRGRWIGLSMEKKMFNSEKKFVRKMKTPAYSKQIHLYKGKKIANSHSTLYYRIPTKKEPCSNNTIVVIHIIYRVQVGYQQIHVLLLFQVTMH